MLRRPWILANSWRGRYGTPPTDSPNGASALAVPAAELGGDEDDPAEQHGDGGDGADREDRPVPLAPELHQRDTDHDGRADEGEEEREPGAADVRVGRVRRDDERRDDQGYQQP